MPSQQSSQPSSDYFVSFYTEMSDEGLFNKYGRFVCAQMRFQECAQLSNTYIPTGREGEKSRFQTILQQNPVLRCNSSTDPCQRCHGLDDIIFESESYFSYMWFVRTCARIGAA